MSDLQYPARILVARHGEAAYAGPDVLTDAGGLLTETGRQQAQDLADRMAGERVTAVYASPLARAQDTAAIVGERLGLPVAVIDGVEEIRVGSLEGRGHDDVEAPRVFGAWLGGDLSVRWPGAQTGEELVARFARSVDELADRHRGETVLVISHGGVMTVTITHTATTTTAAMTYEAYVPNCAVAELAVDAEGWRLVGPWPGRRPSG